MAKSERQYVLQCKAMQCTALQLHLDLALIYDLMYPASYCTGQNVVCPWANFRRGIESN